MVISKVKFNEYSLEGKNNVFKKRANRQKQMKEIKVEKENTLQNTNKTKLIRTETIVVYANMCIQNNYII